MKTEKENTQPIDFTTTPLFHIRYHRRLGFYIGILLHLSFLMFLLFMTFFPEINLIMLFFVMPLCIGGMFIVIPITLKEIDILVYSDRVTISGIDYEIENLEFKTSSIRQGWAVYGKFLYYGEVIEKFAISTELSPEFTNMHHEKFKEYFLKLKSGWLPNEKFNFKKDLIKARFTFLYTLAILIIILIPLIYLISLNS